jgi:small subunit ribosomal protein S17
MAIGFSNKQDEICDDPNCPFHGSLSLRGKIFEGIVTNADMKNTVTVTRDYSKYVSKYKRYERRRGRFSVHNPPCINASKNDFVKIAECRPISKTVSFVVVEKKEQ